VAGEEAAIAALQTQIDGVRLAAQQGRAFEPTFQYVEKLRAVARNPMVKRAVAQESGNAKRIKH